MVQAETIAIFVWPTISNFLVNQTVTPRFNPNLETGTLTRYQSKPGFTNDESTFSMVNNGVFYPCENIG